MPRVSWPLRHGRPSIEIHVRQSIGGILQARTLLADSGAGSDVAPFELVLNNNDCLAYAGHPMGTIQLGGAYTGTFPLYELRVFVPNLSFSKRVRADGVPTTPPNFDGIAGFRFVNRFTYGNFANKTQFGLEL